MAMRKWVSVLLTCAACGGSVPQLTVAPPADLCSTRGSDTYGVLPFGNKTKAQLDLGGASDLLSDAMTGSGCFQLVERERLDALLGEMKLCSDANADKAYMNCGTFAKAGQVLGIKRMVVGDVIFFEPNVKGAELSIKMPGLSTAGIDLGRSYAGLTLKVRIVDVESAAERGSTVVHALLPSDSFQLNSGAAASLNFRASVRNKSAFGEQLEAMLERATKELAEQSRPVGH